MCLHNINYAGRSMGCNGACACHNAKCWLMPMSDCLQYIICKALGSHYAHEWYCHCHVKEWALQSNEKGRTNCFEGLWLNPGESCWQCLHLWDCINNLCVVYTSNMGNKALQTINTGSVTDLVTKTTCYLRWLCQTTMLSACSNEKWKDMSWTWMWGEAHLTFKIKTDVFEC